jgi:Transmembrane protein family 171
VRNWVLIVGGIVLLVVGLLWALQGFNVVGGSNFMSGNSVFAIIGPIVAVVGLIAAVLGLRNARSAA